METVTVKSGVKVFGYARVSTVDQNLDRQTDSLGEAGCDYIFSDKATGKNTDRKEFQRLLSVLVAGDTVIVHSLTRISRSTIDLMNIVNDFKEQNVNFRSIKEPWLDTTTAHGKFIFTIFAGVAEFERELTVSRVKEGLEAAKLRGVTLGRPTEENTTTVKALSLWREGKLSNAAIIKSTGINRSKFYRVIAKERDAI
jgi:DNA invertase Pin-like site-specific DNA recombinase